MLLALGILLVGAVLLAVAGSMLVRQAAGRLDRIGVSVTTYDSAPRPATAEDAPLTAYAVRSAIWAELHAAPGSPAAAGAYRWHWLILKATQRGSSDPGHVAEPAYIAALGDPPAGIGILGPASTFGWFPAPELLPAALGLTLMLGAGFTLASNWRPRTPRPGRT